MKVKDIKTQCWICGRTKKELDAPYEDAPNFKIPLLEVKDMVNYSGYHVCLVCQSIIETFV